MSIRHLHISLNKPYVSSPRLPSPPTVAFRDQQELATVCIVCGLEAI